MERAGAQPDLDWTSIGLLADHEELARATTDEPFGFRGHKKGLFGSGWENHGL
jgi:hypothetical protein